MNERGFAFVTCLLLIAIVLILSAIASQSITSDLKVAGTDRSMKQAFSIAESGSEEARARLSTVSTALIPDGTPAGTTWEAYIGTASRCQQMGYDSSNSNHFRYDSVSGLNYAVKITRASDTCADEDIDALRAHGFSDEDIMDIAQIAAFFNYSNRVANALELRPNAEYHGMAR